MGTRTGDIEPAEWTLREKLALAQLPLYTFKPRPDCPEEFDQQSSFLRSQAKVSVAMGGNRSGKTETAAHKAARYMLCHRDPPRPDTPFMVISDTYRQVGQICWKEKLSRIIPRDAIDWDRVTWYSAKEQLPYVVPLHKRLDGTNWSIEFRSLDQGRQHFQGRSFGGFWFSEQFDFAVFEEVLRGSSDYWFNGGQFAEFTPVDPDLSVAMEERMDNPPPGWAFFRLNTMKNTTLAEGFAEAFFATVSEELLETRRTGAVPRFLGSIYSSWNPAIHVIDTPAAWERLTGAPPPDRYCDAREFRARMPRGWFYRRGMDWGESAEHPFVCLWGAKDAGGNWLIFDEYVEDTGTVLYADRREEIKLRWPWFNDDPFWGMAYADPSRPLLIQEFCAQGIPTTAASNAVMDGIEYVRRLLAVNRLTGRPSLLVYRPNCPRLIKEIRKYRWVQGVTEGKNPHVAKPVPLKWQDDTCDALRYLVYSDRHRFGGVEALPEIVQDSRKHGVLLSGGGR